MSWLTFGYIPDDRPFTGRFGLFWLKWNFLGWFSMWKRKLPHSRIGVVHQSNNCKHTSPFLSSLLILGLNWNTFSYYYQCKMVNFTKWRQFAMPRAPLLRSGGCQYNLAGTDWLVSLQLLCLSSKYSRPTTKKRRVLTQRNPIEMCQMNDKRKWLLCLQLSLWVDDSDAGIW